MNKYLKEILSDCKGRLSSKRVIGMLSSLSLIISSYIHPSEVIFGMVLTLALGGLGLSSLDKHIEKIKEDKKDE